MERIVDVTSPKDGGTLTTQTILAVCHGMNEKLHQLKSKIQNINKVKATLREEMNMLQDLLSDWPDDGSTFAVTYRDLVKHSDETYTFIERTAEMTKDQVKSLLSHMETQLKSISEITHRLLFRLQESMSVQTQFMQMISNIMKEFHDAAEAIIQNMR